MTRKKPRLLDKLRGGLTEVDKKLGTGHDVNDSKIKELESQMDTKSIDDINIPGFNNQRNFAKRSKKSYKSLR